MLLDSLTNTVSGITVPTAKGTGINVTKLLNNEMPGHDCGDIAESVVANI